jgi:molecular chaperone DnaJ
MYNIDEGMNCVYKCLSSTCYDTVYGDNPLEDGEIDTVRYRTYQNCVRQEFKKSLVDRTKAQRKQETTL